MNDWPHQQRGVAETLAAIEAGHRRICLTSPTGGGKSLIMQRLVERFGRALVITNRIMLYEQFSRSLVYAGMEHAIHAAGYAPDESSPVQVASIQTLYKRWKAGDVRLPDADVVMLDEAHNETGQRMREIQDHYVERDVPFVSVTATPVGIGDVNDVLITAGSNSELRKCGALVAAQTYNPDEPSRQAFKKQKTITLQFFDEVREVMIKCICGSAIDYYRILNPSRRPAILFAPGVDESIWFTEQFNAAGLPWSHIDAKRIILNGEVMESTADNRDRLRRASETGETLGVSNRFVLREGIDWPHLWHGIVACTFSGVTGYVQALGRLLRKCAGKNECLVQDHGGNWRHDSINCDRIWTLDDTDDSVRIRQQEIYRTKAKPEPVTCPKCRKSRASGLRCPACGYIYEGHKRMVWDKDGTLKAMYGDVFRPRKVCTDPAAHKAWVACYFRCRKTGRTFNQARALFQRENNWEVPAPDFPFMPTVESDWGQRIVDVPYSRLTKKEKAAL